MRGAGCALEVGWLALFPKPHNLVIVWVSAKSLPEKEGPKSNCWLQPADPFTGPECARVASSAVGYGAVHSPGWCYNNRNAHSWKGGVWVSQEDWLPTDFHHQILCRCLFPSLLFWFGGPCTVGLRPHTPGGREVFSFDTPLEAATPGCGGQPFPRLHPSYQSLCGFFFKSFIIIFPFSWTSVDHSCWLKL